MVGVQEQLSLLVQLQALDRAIDSITEQKNAIPQEIARQTKALKEREQASLAIKKDIEALQRARKQDELEAESKNTELKKFQAQLFEVKTNKEYQAMQAEISDRKAHKAKAEDSVLQKMMAEDEKKKDLAAAMEAFKAFEKEFKALEQSLNANLAELEKELAAKMEERTAAAQKVEAKSLGIYDRIRKNEDGVALSQITNSTCGECHMSLRPQITIELTKQDHIVFCDSCSRILYL